MEPIVDMSTFGCRRHHVSVPPRPDCNLVRGLVDARSPNASRSTCPRPAIVATAGQERADRSRLEIDSFSGFQYLCGRLPAVAGVFGRQFST